MRTLQTVVFIAYFTLMMIVFGGTIFAVMVEYPNWFASVPESLEATRTFYRALHPGYFFQIFGPLMLITGIAFVAVGWRTGPTRNRVLVSLGIFVAIELLTFLYIYPRLNIMFGPDASRQTVDVLRQAAADFTFADRIRTAMDLVATGISMAACFSLFRYRYEGESRLAS